jgi:uncharacterized protein involved in outer membrane biogenesis
MRKLLVALIALLLIGSAGLFFWARAVFSQDPVRDALAAQLSSMLGQPVSIGSISAGIYPRVTVALRTVTIGQPAGIEIDTLDLGADFRALLSRRIERATVRVDGAKVQLPLLPLGAGDASEPPDAGAAAALPVTLVSVDAINLTNIELVSAGRSLQSDAELVLQPDGSLLIRQASLSAEDTAIEATGRITDLNGPVGELKLEAGVLNLDRLLGFLSDFAGGLTDTPADQSRVSAKNESRPDLTADIRAVRARLAGISLDTVSARAHVTDAGIELQPISFATFGGTYGGSLTLVTSGDTPSFVVKGSAQNIDLPAVTRFAGTEADPITGRLSADLELTGAGAEMTAAMRTMRGTARVSVRDGIVRNLGLVRAIVIATSMRGSASTAAGAGAAGASEAARSRDEPFKTLSATLAVTGTTATTNDLQFEGTDVSMSARGSIALDGSRVQLTGRVQLSPELTKQAGTDLVRYTQENGRVTLPVEISGTAEEPSVTINVADLMERAIRNRAEEELKITIKKGLEGILKRPPK